MPVPQVALTRVMTAEDIRKVGVSPPYLTSCGLNWAGVEVHRFRLSRGETQEHSYPQLCVILTHSSTPVNGELFIAGQCVRAKLSTGTVSIAPSALPHKTSRDSPCEVTVIHLDPAIVTEIARAETGCDVPEILAQYGIVDPLIRSIGMMLDAELSAEHPSSRVYAESLAAALAAQVFAKYASRVPKGSQSPRANRTQLRRSIDFINDNLHQDLTLAEIASVANMSKYHFAKSFRQLVGIPPHRYLVKVRIEKARKLLALDTLSVEEIANRVGYSDKGHFAAQFIKIMGVSPNRYRLNI